jgi:DNA-binding CsgD family transcriptional regulator
MNDSARLLTLIGNVYDAALEPSKWVDVLAGAASFVGGPAASVYSKALAHSRSEIYFQYGIDPDYEQLYVETYAKIDPLTHRQLVAEVGDIISTENYMSHDEFKQTRFYKEWAYPQRLVDGATTVLQKMPTAVAMFTVFRHQRDGLVNDEMRERMQLLAPHIRRAILIGRQLDQTQSQSIAFTDALDGLSAGVFLVDASGRLVHANTAARALLSVGDVLSAANSRLLARDPAVNALLRDAFVAADDRNAAKTKVASLPITTRTGDTYVAHVLPLTSDRRRGSAATSALFISKADLATSSSAALIARRYKLTATELRVLLAIVEIGGVPDVAEALGVGDATVRTHLSRLFEKTGVKRQADLVKLVAGFSNPLHG